MILPPKFRFVAYHIMPFLLNCSFQADWLQTWCEFSMSHSFLSPSKSAEFVGVASCWLCHILSRPFPDARCCIARLCSNSRNIYKPGIRRIFRRFWIWGWSLTSLAFLASKSYSSYLVDFVVMIGFADLHMGLFKFTPLNYIEPCLIFTISWTTACWETRNKTGWCWLVPRFLYTPVFMYGGLWIRWLSSRLSSLVLRVTLTSHQSSPPPRLPAATIDLAATINLRSMIATSLQLFAVLLELVGHNWTDFQFQKIVP